MVASAKCSDVSPKIESRILEQVEKLCLFELLFIEEFRENVEGLSAKQLLELINDFLSGEHGEVEAYLFLKLLAYYPKSMANYQLTPLMQTLITSAYYIGQSGFYTSKLSMEDLAKIFHRSKKTIYDCIKKHQKAIEENFKPVMEEEKLRMKAREIALRELVEEEKLRLKQEEKGNK